MSDNPKKPPGQTYSPAQVGEMLDMKPSTLRRLSALYADQLSPTAQGEGRKRRYDDQDILKIRRIAEMTRDRRTHNEIRAALAVDVLESEPEKPTSALALVPEILEGFERISAQLARMESDRQADRETMTRLEGELERLRAELEEQRRPFWDKIRKRFRRQPPE